MRGICMLLVILHHSGAPDEYQKFLSPFFLSGFFFISGYLFDNPYKTFNWKLKLIRIFESLIIPYFLYWIITYFIVAGYTEVYQKGNYNIILPFLKEILLGSKLWFMSALISSEIVLTFILLFVKKRNITLLTIAACFIGLWFFTPLSEYGMFYPWYANCACISIVFMICGILFRRMHLLRKNKILYSSVVLYILLYIIDLAYNVTHFMFATNYFNNILLFIIYAIIGIVGLACISQKYIPSNRILNYYGKNSLLVYFFCNQIITVCFKATSSFTINWYLKSLLITVIVCIIIPLPIYVSHKLLPWMSGSFNKISTYYLSKK